MRVEEWGRYWRQNGHFRLIGISPLEDSTVVGLWGPSQRLRQSKCAGWLQHVVNPQPPSGSWLSGRARASPEKVPEPAKQLPKQPWSSSVPAADGCNGEPWRAAPLTTLQYVPPLLLPPAPASAPACVVLEAASCALAQAVSELPSLLLMVR